MYSSKGDQICSLTDLYWKGVFSKNCFLTLYHSCKHCSTFCLQTRFATWRSLEYITFFFLQFFFVKCHNLTLHNLNLFKFLCLFLFSFFLGGGWLFTSGQSCEPGLDPGLKKNFSPVLFFSYVPGPPFYYVFTFSGSWWNVDCFWPKQGRVYQLLRVQADAGS